MSELNVRLMQHKYSQSEWESKNPTLSYGELGICDNDDGTVIMKCGDGIRSWSELPDIISSSVSGEEVDINKLSFKDLAKYVSSLIMKGKNLNDYFSVGDSYNIKRLSNVVIETSTNNFNVKISDMEKYLENYGFDRNVFRNRESKLFDDNYKHNFVVAEDIGIEISGTFKEDDYFTIITEYKLEQLDIVKIVPRDSYNYYSGVIFQWHYLTDYKVQFDLYRTPSTTSKSFESKSFGDFYVHIHSGGDSTISNLSEGYYSFNIPESEKMNVFDDICIPIDFEKDSSGQYIVLYDFNTVEEHLTKKRFKLTYSSKEPSTGSLLSRNYITSPSLYFRHGESSMALNGDAVSDKPLISYYLSEYTDSMLKWHNYKRINDKSREFYKLDLRNDYPSFKYGLDPDVIKYASERHCTYRVWSTDSGSNKNVRIAEKFFLLHSTIGFDFSEDNDYKTMDSNNLFSHHWSGQQNFGSTSYPTYTRLNGYSGNPEDTSKYIVYPDEEYPVAPAFMLSMLSAELL